MTSRRSNGEGTVYQRADGRWEAAVYIRTASGIRKRLRLYGHTRDEASRKLRRALAQTDAGIPVPDHAWTVAAYLNYWLPIVKLTKRPTTYIAYESIVRLYLRPNLGHRPLPRLTVAELQRYLDEQLSAGCSIRTVQKQRTVLSAALTRAQREELVVRNVARHVELPTWRRQEIVPWTDDQLRSFLRAAADDPLFAAFTLLALYGLRRSEVLGLQWRDIDFEANRIHIRQQLQRYDGSLHLGPVKTNAGRRDLPLLSSARRALLAQRPQRYEPDTLIFQTKFDNPIEGGNLVRAFYRIAATAGLPRIKLHHLRHTTATLLKNLGVPARDTQLILGHATIVTTQQLYQHADLSGQLSALSQLERALVDDRARSRQGQPSNHKYERSKSLIFSGGSSQTRTGDTRLFRLDRDAVPTNLTEVKLLAQQRFRLGLLGAAAVISSRQDV